MNESAKSGFTLALDTAIGTGSVAIVRGSNVVDQLGQGNGLSRSETLAHGIATLISRSALDVSSLEKIVVSLGPGSFTGLRLGLAFAKGLAAASGATIVGQTILDAIASYKPFLGRTLVIAPMGRADVMFQLFETDGDGTRRLSEPGVASQSDIQTNALILTTGRVHFHPECPGWVGGAIEAAGVEGEETDETVAVMIGRAAEGVPDPPPLEPIYLQRSAFRGSVT